MISPGKNSLAEGPPEELRARRGVGRREVVGRGLNENVTGPSWRSRPQVRSASLENGSLFIELNGSGSEMSSLIPLLIEAGVQIEEIIKSKVSLEDVFLDNC